MRAFLMSLVALVIIAVVAGVALRYVPMSSQDVYTEHNNVRL